MGPYELADDHWADLLKAWSLMAERDGVDPSDQSAMINLIKVYWHALSDHNTVKAFILEEEIAKLQAAKAHQETTVLPQIDTDIAAKQAELAALQP